MMNRFVICALAAMLAFPTIPAAQSVVWDTISTGCIRLVVGSNGEMGHNGLGKANMDFAAFGSDCDTAATVYLRSGGPIAAWMEWVGYAPDVGDIWTYRMANAMYQTDTLGDGWIPVPGTGAGHRSGAGWDGYFTGNFRSRGAHVTMRRTYYAPTGGADSCNFVIVKSELVNTNVSPVIGEQIDWDVPTGVGKVNASGITMSGYNFAAYQQGIDNATGGNCPGVSDSTRFAAFMYLNAIDRYDTCLFHTEVRGLYTELNDTFLAMDALPDSARQHRYLDKLWAEGVYTSLYNGNIRTVFLPYPGWFGTANFYAVLATVRQGNRGELEHTLATARAWYYDHLRPHCIPVDTAGCCLRNSADGRTGNIDCDIQKGVDISDLTRMIDYLFISFQPLCCVGAADFAGDGNIDIADLADLIDYLYIVFSPTPQCR